MFSVTFVCHSVHRRVPVQGPSPTLSHTGPCPTLSHAGPCAVACRPLHRTPVPAPLTCSNLLNFYLTIHGQLDHYEARTVGKRAVGIRLKCLLVYYATDLLFFHSTLHSCPDFNSLLITYELKKVRVKVVNLRHAFNIVHRH